MAESVVESLEVVEVEEKNCKRLVFSAGQLQFSVERFFEEASVEQPSQRIANGLFPKLFAQLQAGQGKRNLRGGAGSQSLARTTKALRPRIGGWLCCLLELEMQNPKRVSLPDHGNAQTLGY